MRSLNVSLSLVLAFVATVSAVPITPAAPGLQRRAEQMRIEGLNEVRSHPFPLSLSSLISMPSTNHHLNPLQHEIAEKLTTSPLSDTEDPDQIDTSPLSVQILETLYSLLEADADESQDVSGNISPGSLDAPESLPLAPEPLSVMEEIKAVVWHEDVERRGFGYEGRERELRRPEGMRHWD